MHAMVPLTETATKQKPGVVFRLVENGIVTLLGRKRSRHFYEVDLNRLSLSAHLPANTYIKDRDRVILLYTMYLYTIRLANVRMMRRLTSVPREVVTHTQDSVFKSFHIVQFKMATLRCVIQRLNPENADAIRANFIACGLRGEDSIFFHLMYHNGDIPAFIALMGKIEDSTFTLDPKSLTKELETDVKKYNELAKTANYFAYRKLMFVAVGNRFDPADLAQDLLERGIQAYYWVRPFHNELHAVNYAKSAIRGYHNVLREYYTNQDRQRLYETEEGGHDNRIISLTDEVGVDNLYEVEDQMVTYLDERRRYYA